MQDYLELQLSKREMVRRMEVIVVSPLEDLLREDLLAMLSCKDPSIIGKYFFPSYLT